MEKKELTCIVCPMSCHLEVTLGDTGEIVNVTGNTCKRGDKYARTELTSPVRMLTSTVKLEGGLYKRLPVITSDNIPKEKMTEVMEAISQVKVVAPVKINDIIIEDVCGLGVNIIASRSMDKIDE